MRRIGITLAGLGLFALLGCANAPAAAVSYHAHHDTSLPPECITVTLHYRTHYWRHVQFCGTGSLADSPVRDWAAGHTLKIGWGSGQCIKTYIAPNSGNGAIIKTPFCGTPRSPMFRWAKSSVLIVDGTPLQNGAVILYEG